jgi:hypothetical protein
VVFPFGADPVSTKAARRRAGGRARLLGRAHE